MTCRSRIRTLARASTLSVCAAALACDADSPPPPAPLDHQTESVATVEVTALPDSLEVGETLQLQAAARCSHGQPVHGVVFRWSTSTPEQVRVSPTGVVTALRSGMATVEVATDDVERSVSLRLAPYGRSVGPDGGTLEYGAGRIRLVAGPGALPGPVRLTVEEAHDVPASGAGRSTLVPGMAWRFGPEGIRFESPVRLQFRYDPLDLPPMSREARLRVHRLADGAWTPLDASEVNPAEGVVTGWTTHFSDYGVLDYLPPVRSVVVTPTNGVIEVGTTLALHAEAVDTSGRTIVAPDVAWASDDEDVVYVDPEGRATGLGAGRAVVTAESGGVEGSAVVEVQVPLSDLTITPVALSLFVGGSDTLEASMHDDAGTAVRQRVTWSSDDAAVAVVDDDGVVTGLASGRTLVRAASGGRSATVPVDVAVEPMSLTLAPRDLVPDVGQTVEFTARVLDADGNELDVPVSWRVSDPTRARLDGPGRVTGLALGYVSLEATYRHRSDRVQLHFVAPEEDRPAEVVTPDRVVVLVGSSYLLEPVVLNSAAGVLDVSVAFESENTAVAVVDPSGRVQAVSPGSTWIVVRAGDAVGRTQVTVSVTEPGGGDDGYGNNLSVPVVFTEGIGLTGLPVAADPGVRPTPAEGIEVGSLPFFHEGNTPDLDGYYLQGTANTWRAEWVDGSSSPPHAARVHWGDNLTHRIWSQESTVSIEQTLTAAAAAPMAGFAMPYSSGGHGSDAVWGTDGTVVGATPTLVTAAARLVIQKLDDATREPIHTVVDAPLAASFGSAEGPGSFVAGVGGTGAVAYGYTLMLGGVTLPAGMEKAGWWRATLQVDAEATVDGAVVPANLRLTELEGADAHEITFVPQIDPDANRTWLDFMVAAEGGGTQGGRVMAVEVEPDLLVVDVADTARLTARTLGAGGKVLDGRPITWRSEDGGVAVVDQTGLVTGVARGSTWILAGSGNVAGYARVSVQPGGGGAVAEVAIEPATASVAVGATVRLRARVEDAEGHLLDRPVAWSVDDQGVATVDGVGLVTGVAAGIVTVTAQAEGVAGSARVTVSDGHEGEYGSNLSVPVVFAEGIGLTALPVSEDPGLRPTAGEGVTVTERPFFFEGNVPDWEDPAGSWYLQHGPNTWQADWLDGSVLGQRAARAAWGDNLTHQTWTTHSTIRLETVLYDLEAGALEGFVTAHLAGQPPDEIWGTQGTRVDLVPTLYSVLARLTIQKLDDDTREPVHTWFDGAIHEAGGEGGPGSFGAEVNRAGKVIYGYGLRMPEVDLPPGLHKAGWWRIAFSLDPEAVVAGRSVAANVRLTEVAGSNDPDYAFAPELDVAGNRTWVDIYVEPADGGVGGGGGGGGGTHAVSAVSVFPRTPGLAPGGTFPLSATVLDESQQEVVGAHVSWSSDRPSVVTVDEAGTVTGLTTGTARITATSGGRSATVVVTVLPEAGSGPEEGLGNNLSAPLIFAEGYGLSGLPAAVDPGVRPTPDEGVTVTGLPFFAPGNVPDYTADGTDYHLQQGPNTWRAAWVDGSTAIQSAEVRWGDNLTHQTWTTHALIRVETTLSALDAAPMEGFAMTWLYGQGADEMHGTDGATTTETPLIFSVVPRLTIQKLDDDTRQPVFTAFDGSVAEGLAVDGPGTYGAEVNVAGRIVYGHTFRVRDLTMPDGVEKHGWWRLTFGLDPLVTVGGAAVPRGVRLDRCGNTADGDELAYTPVLHDSGLATVLDIFIVSARPGSGGGGSHGGEHAGGGHSGGGGASGGGCGEG